MAILLSDILGRSTSHGRIPIFPRTGTQTITGADSNTMLVSRDVTEVTWQLGFGASGSCVRIAQGDVGVIQFVPASSQIGIENALGFTRSGGRDCELVATVTEQSGDTGCTWLLTGTMQP